MSDTAILAGGCFWCMEAVFAPLRGVEKVISGYIGGDLKNPTYRQVCTGTTGHAEALEVTFDPKQVSYGEIIEIFFAFHDPTTPDRQGADVGSQYRSAIFYRSEEQKTAAQAMIGRLTRDGAFAAPIVTQIAPASEFFPAEEYHRNYYAENPSQPYCRAVIAPKVAKLRAEYSARLKE